VRAQPKPRFNWRTGTKGHGDRAEFPQLHAAKTIVPVRGDEGSGAIDGFIGPNVSQCRTCPGLWGQVGRSRPGGRDIAR